MDEDFLNDIYHDYALLAERIGAAAAFLECVERWPEVKDELWEWAVWLAVSEMIDERGDCKDGRMRL